MRTAVILAAITLACCTCATTQTVNVPEAGTPMPDAGMPNPDAGTSEQWTEAQDTAFLSECFRAMGSAEEKAGRTIPPPVKIFICECSLEEFQQRVTFDEFRHLSNDEAELIGTEVGEICTKKLEARVKELKRKAEKGAQEL